MKTACGFIGWMVGMFIGFAFVNSVPILAFICIIGGFPMGRYIGGLIEEEQEQEKKEKDRLYWDNYWKEREKEKKAAAERLAKLKEEEESRKRTNATIGTSLDARGFIRPYVNRTPTSQSPSPSRTSAYSSTSSVQNTMSTPSRQSILDGLNSKVSGWDKLFGLPYFYFYNYYPKNRYSDIELTETSLFARITIYSFKNGNDYSQHVVSIMDLKLKQTFSTDVSKLCLVCIPASTISTNNYRYRGFSETLCSKTGMSNGFSHIHITKEKSASHLGGEDSAEYSIDKDFFKDKFVVLFDDVVTRGRSMRQFKVLIEQSGATVICAMSIGRTVYGDVRKPHPWNGTY